MTTTNRVLENQLIIDFLKDITDVSRKHGIIVFDDYAKVKETYTSLKGLQIGWDNNKKEYMAIDFRGEHVIKDFVEDFKNFTTYFTGFHQNRENMYSEEEKSSAIVYRLVHQNLPKFVDNLNIFEKVKESPVAEKFEQLYKDLEKYQVVFQLLWGVLYYSEIY